ncbi:MAG: hydrogenase nickel incorporation protein HypB [Clostridia bacterium]|nr:hydrogenase nickel incorporation protein HypB [Clostridia bacterium]
MKEVRTIVLSKSVFEENDKEADALRLYLKDKGVFLVNVMSSPGAGKTTTLISVIKELSKFYRVGIMEADIDSDVDAVKVAKETGCKSIQLHTGGMCHLDAGMTTQGLTELGLDDVDIVFLENVGNLVCPAEYDTGAHLDMMILSVPEGDDKPLKYPLIFQKCELVLINKIDTLPYFNFSLDKVKQNISYRNEKSFVIPISAKLGDGIDEVVDYFKTKIQNIKTK